jgi:Tfp pilus assembly major pilin PilA
MKNKRTQQGFLALETLLIAVIAAIITTVAVFVWQSSAKANKSLTNAGSVQGAPTYVKRKTNPPAQPANPSATTPSLPSGSTSKKSSAPPASVTHPTDEDRDVAKAKLYTIKSNLEAYWVQGTYYPSDISPSNFSGTCSGDCSTPFAPTPGINVVYTPSPNGCTTAANNCQHYTLKAVETSGAVLLQLNSIY